MARLSPILTATIQATVLSSISNVLAQAILAHRASKPFTLNIAEFLRFVILTILTAPPNFLWQAWLERTFPGRKASKRHNILSLSPRNSDDRLRELEMEMLESGRSDARSGERGGRSKEMAGEAEDRRAKANEGLDWANTFKKWAIDCMTVGALVNTVLFLVIMNGMKGKGLDGITAAVRSETVPIIVAGWKIWPIASIISFSLIPVERRIVFLSAIGLAWGVYLSLVAARQ